MNEYLQSFKDYLISQRHAKSTVKNYLADASRFMRWYENSYSQIFTPSSINSDIINKYQSISSANQQGLYHAALSSRSRERHLFSLKKFIVFLLQNNLITHNPLAPASGTPTTKLDDPLNTHGSILKGFKDYLYSSNASSLTIKNYISDIKHFLDWLKVVLQQQKIETGSENFFKYLTSSLIENYKELLLHERNFSPISINRKLSALRRFIFWLSEQGLVGTNERIRLQQIGNIHQGKNIFKESAPSFNPPSDITEAKKGTAAVIRQKTSRLAPLRLYYALQLTTNHLFDTLLILPLVSLTRKLQYIFLVIKGKSIFYPLIHKTKEIGLLRRSKLDNLIVRSVFAGKSAISYKNIPDGFSNFSKYYYDPLNVSLDELPFRKRLFHILRYKRPSWYKKYHEYPVVHYLHFGIFLAFIGVLVFWLQFHFFEKPLAYGPIFASTPLIPPRILSFRGRLTDEFDNPIQAESTLRFALYQDESASGSALMWQEVLAVSPNTDGNFITTLGRTNPIQNEIFEQNPDIYLGVTREQNPEMAPRQKLATVGLAEDSQSLQGLRPITLSGEDRNTLLALDSAGNLALGGSAHSIQATEGELKLTGTALIFETNVGSGGSLILSPDAKGTIDVQKPLINSTDNGNLTSAIGSVEVNDTFAILATSSAIAALNIQQESTGMLISASGSGSTKFSLDYLGNTYLAGSLTLDGNGINSQQSTFHFLPENVINLFLGETASAISIGSTTGNTTFRNSLNTQGSTILGDGQDDSIILNGRIASDLIASESAKYNLGSSNNSFNNAYLTNLFLSSSATTSGFLKRSNDSLSFTNSQDSLLLGGNTPAAALIKLAGTSGQDTFFNAGNVGIGTASLSDKLHVLGDVRIGAASSDGCLKRFDGTAIAGSCSSDIRLKQNIKSLDGVLEKIAKLTPVTYSMNTNEFPEYGFADGIAYGLIAQELEQYFPDLVAVDKYGYKTVKYGPELTMLSLAAIKELQQNSLELDRKIAEFPINLQGNITILKDDSSKYAVKDERGIFITLSAALRRLDVGTLTGGLITAKEAALDSLAVVTDRVTIAGDTLREYILKTIDESGINNSAGITSTLISADKVKTGFISPLASDSLIGINLEDSQFSILDSPSSSGSAVATIDRMGNATFSGTLQAQGLQTQDASISGTLRAGKIAADTIEGLDAKLATLSASASNSATVTNIYNVYNTASLAAVTENTTDATSIQPASASSALQTDQLFTSFMPLGSSSASLAYVPNLSADFATVNQGLMVLGYSSVADLSVTGQLSINSSFTLAKNSINTLGTALEIQPLRQGIVNVMGGLFSIDTDGNLSVEGNANFAKDVSIKGKLSTNLIAPIPGSDLVIDLPGGTDDTQTVINNANLAALEALKDTKFVVRNASGSSVLSVNRLGDIIASGTAAFKNVAVESLKIVRGASADTSAIETIASGSAGIGVITKGYTTRTIYTPFVKEDSLIYISPSSQTADSIPYLSRQIPENVDYGIKSSFTIQIPKAVTEDVQFNWWIID